MAIKFSGGAVLEKVTENGDDLLHIPRKTARPLVPAFFARRNSGHVSGAKYVSYNSVWFDNTGDFSTDTFTCPVDGIYWFAAWTMDQGGSTSYKNDYWTLRVNNAIVQYAYTSNTTSARAQRNAMICEKLSAGDTVRVYNQNSYIYATSAVYCHFEGCLLQV